MAESHDVDRQPLDETPHRELALAARRFLAVARNDPRLQILLLVDPIQAFADAGIPLTKRARKLLRRYHPDCSYGNQRLYEGVKTGAIRLAWIDKVELGEPRKFDGTPDAN